MLSDDPISQPEPSVQFHFLGRLDYGQSRALQQHLAESATQRAANEIVVLMCEHDPVISIGRAGSRRDIDLSDDELRERHLEIQWDRRGGPAMLHVPGQLAIYPVVPLLACQWTVGEYLQRLQTGVRRAITSLRLGCETTSGSYHLSGRTGLFATMGVGVRDWLTSGGMWLNVNPSMSDFRYVRCTVPVSAVAKETMGSLAAERQGTVSMAGVRAALVPALAASFDRERYFLHTGHPWVGHPRNAGNKDSKRARAC